MKNVVQVICVLTCSKTNKQTKNKEEEEEDKNMGKRMGWDMITGASLCSRSLAFVCDLQKRWKVGNQDSNPVV